MNEEFALLRAEVADLRHRVARNERRRRWLTVASGLIALACVALVTAEPGAAQRDGIRMQAPFVVTGRDGRVLFRITDSPHGGVLTVNDRKGKAIARIHAAPELRGLATYDQNGVITASSGLSHSIVTGAPTRGLRSYDSEGRAGLGIQVVLRDGNFEARSMSAFDAEGKRIIEIGNHADGFLGFSANPGLAAAPMQAGVSALGTPGVSVRTGTGDVRGTLFAGPESGEVSLFDSLGGQVFHAP